MATDRRSDTDRYRVVISCRMVAIGAVNTIIVSNVSSTGIGGRCMVPLQPGDQIQIGLPGIGGILAQVRWSVGTRFGARLSERITPEAVRLPLRIQNDRRQMARTA